MRCRNRRIIIVLDNRQKLHILPVVKFTDFFFEKSVHNILISVGCRIVWSSDAIDFVNPELFRREAGVGCEKPTEDQHQRENTDTKESMDVLQPVSSCTLRLLSILRPQLCCCVQLSANSK